MKYSKDLSNVQPGDIRLVQFEVGPAHPLYNKWVPAEITRVIKTTSRTGIGIEAETIEPVIWPEDPKGSFIDKGKEIQWVKTPVHSANHSGWVKTKGHLETQNYPIKMWVSRYADGHLVMTVHKPVLLGEYWVDPLGITIPMSSTYFPEVTFLSGPKEVTYKTEF